MSKGGRSEKVKFLGLEYIEHRDTHGNKTGTSHEHTGPLGIQYIEHRDRHGNKTGTSYERTGPLGVQYLAHYDEQGRRIGRSEQNEDLPSTSVEQNSDEEDGLGGVGFGGALVVGVGAIIAGFIVLIFAAVTLLVAVVISVVAIPTSLFVGGIYWFVKTRSLSPVELTAVDVEQVEHKGSLRSRIDKHALSQHLLPVSHLLLLTLPAVLIAATASVAWWETSERWWEKVMLLIGAALAVLFSWWCLRTLLCFLARRAVLNART